MTVTQIRILGSEKSYLANFRLTEQKLISAEKLMAQGLDVNHLVETETFRPKNFRSKAGINSQHFKLTATTQDQHSRTDSKTTIQSIIRVDVPKETSSSSKKASATPRKNERTVQRLEWKKP
ncbi:hypothetical protein AOC33_03925 [Polynucleobacter cosmopolitanus]|uniref:Uncharacterized protein n=2 Tax=Polynucleobacter cosmopolitanus TaxID=351345 RepID=A0A229FWL5_9BURK|nr:hypothetical protein AOC33_03925 [Polynucleobacter cosmopolitanus]